MNADHNLIMLAQGAGHDCGVLVIADAGLDGDSPQELSVHDPHMVAIAIPIGGGLVRRGHDRVDGIDFVVGLRCLAFEDGLVLGPNMVLFGIETQGRVWNSQSLVHLFDLKERLAVMPGRSFRSALPQETTTGYVTTF